MGCFFGKNIPAHVAGLYRCTCILDSVPLGRLMNKHHAEVLGLIKEMSGVATQHTFLDSYLGNSHPRYPINAPTLRAIAKDWMRAHRDMSAKDLANMLTSMAEGKSGTKKNDGGNIARQCYERSEAVRSEAVRQ